MQLCCFSDQINLWNLSNYVHKQSITHVHTWGLGCSVLGQSLSIHCPKSDLCRRWHCLLALPWICSYLNFNHTPPYCRPVGIVAAPGFDSLVLFNFFETDYFLNCWRPFEMRAECRGIGRFNLSVLHACVSQCRWAGRSLSPLSYEWCSNLCAVAG